jgi:hypothetical protein
MILRWCESPGNAARIAALSADHAPTAIIGCPHMTMPPFIMKRSIWPPRAGATSADWQRRLS